MSERKLQELTRAVESAIDQLDQGHPVGEELQFLLLRLSHHLRGRQKEQQELRDSLRYTLSELHARLDQLSRVRDLADFLSTHRESEGLFDHLPAFFRLAFGAEAASILLLDPQEDQLVFVGAEMADGRQDLVGQPVALGEGISGWVAATGLSRLAPDVSRDPQFMVRADCPITIGSLLCAPLMDGKRVLGVVNLSHSCKQQFSEDDELLLNMLCETASVAIAQARLAEALKLEAVSMAGELAEVRDFFFSIVRSSDDLIVVLGADLKVILVSAALAELLNYDSKEVIDRRPGDSFLNTASASELESTLLGGMIIRDHDVLLNRRDGSQVHASVNGSPIRSEQGNTMGYLCIFRSIERRVRVYQMLKELSARLTVLFDAAVEVSSSLKVDEVLNLVLVHMQQLLGADGGQLMLLSADGRSLLRWQPESRLAEERIPLSDCPEGVVVRQPRPLLLSEPAAVRQFLPDADASLQSTMMVPLAVKEDVLGVIRVDSHDPTRLFSNQDLRLATTFATQAALAIENSRLYSATQRETNRLRGLLDLSREVARMHSREQILDLFARSSVRLTGARAAVVYEVRPAEGMLRRVAQYTDDLPLSPAPVTYTINYFSDDPLNTLLREPDMPLRYSPLPETPPAWVPEPVNKGISLLVVPVEEAGDTYGLLLLYWDEQEQLMSEDESFLSVMSMQAASAIRTERLLAENEASQTFLSNVIYSATDAIIVTDRMGRITLFNRGAVDMLGISEREALGRMASELYQDPTLARNRMRQALREDEPSMTFETVVINALGGELTVQLTLSWLRDKSGRIAGILGVAKDISELKKLEQARQEAERLKDIERMAVTVSDRINTPLAVIMMHLEMVREMQSGLDPAAGKSLEAVEEQVGRVKTILDSLNAQKRVQIKKYGLPNVDMYDLESGAQTEQEETDDSEPAPQVKRRNTEEETERKPAPVANAPRRSAGHRRAVRSGNSERE